MRSSTRRKYGGSKRKRPNNDNRRTRKRVYMPEEFHGAGLIILDWRAEKVHVLLVKGVVGKWGFPKGKREDDEKNSLITAKREAEEETSLKEEHYDVHDLKLKILDVVFRYATIKPEHRDKVLISRPHEIIDLQWFPLAEIDKLEGTNYSLRLYLQDLADHPWWMKTITRLAKINQQE